MEVVTTELDHRSVGDIGKCDGEFTVDSKLVLHAENNEILYTTISVPSFKKRYGQDEVDYAAYVDDPDKTAFLAYVNGQMAGQIILRKNWNRYAYIEDIVVDLRFRRRKVGKALIAQAKDGLEREAFRG